MNGGITWDQVPWYWAGEMLGAFLGAVLVYIHYLPHWAETHDAGAKLAVFATGPAIRRPASNFATEVIGTVVVVSAVLAIAANAQSLRKPGDIDLLVVFSTGLQPLLVGFLVWGIGLSLGGPTGYAINPARDLGPRIAHAVLPIAGKGDADWGYSWIPVIAPIVGGVLGAQLFRGVGF